MSSSFLSGWFTEMQNRWTKGRNRRVRPSLGLERLEERTVPAFALQPTTYPTDAGPVSLALGDVNRDGADDAIAVNTNNGTVSVLLGNGNGSFGAAANFTVGAGAFDVAIGDLNGDGNLDLAVANFTSNTVSVLLGNGNGTFQAAVNFPAGVSTAGVAIGDVNGDGRPDLVTGDYTAATASVLLGNGNGTFQPATAFPTGSGTFDVALGDVNVDGRLDIIAPNAGAGNISVLLGNGNGTFQAAQNFTAPGPVSVALGEVNGDGRPDLVVANFGTNNVSVLLGNGNGSFQPATNLPAGTGTRAVALGDTNRDGRLDIVAANTTSNDVSVLLGNGNGTFQPATNTGVPGGPTGMALADLNRDGQLDIATANNTSNNVAVLLNTDTTNASGRFLSAQNFGTPVGPYDIAQGDVNGDGKIDLATANFGTPTTAGNTVSVLLGNGNGTFSAPTSFTVGNNPGSVALADVNGDGKLDLVVGSYGSNLVSVLLGDGNGTFGAAANFATGNNTFDVAVGDFNADGLLDLVASNTSSNNVSLLLGNGNGSFQAAQNFAVGSGPGFVAVGDVNNDGKLDVVTPNAGTAAAPGNSVSVLLGNGNGTFQAAQNFTTDVAPFSAALADVNSDGKLDLVTASIANGTVSVLLGNGNGTFGTATHFVAGSSLTYATVADIDNDGLLDIAAVDNNSSLASVLLGNGNGTFQPATFFFTGTAPGSLVLADVNVDGKLDFLAANRQSNNVSVLLASPNLTVAFQLQLSATTVLPGETFNITVTAFNAQGQPDTGYRGTVVFMSNDPQATLPANYTFTAADAGVKSFTGLRLNRGGNDTITVTDLNDSTLFNNSTITVNKPFDSDKLGAYRASNGSWSLDSDGSFGFNASSDQVFLRFSPAGVTGVAGDWLGTGRANIGDFKDGVWHLDLNNNGIVDAGETFNFGGVGDKPVVGDWNGDGKTKLGVFRAAADGVSGQFILDTNNNRQADAGDETFIFGTAADRVVVGDWTGDGKTKVGVFRDAKDFNPSAAGAAVFTLDINNNHTFDVATDEVFIFGVFTDGLVVGDWNGNGIAKVGVYRNGTAVNAPGVALFSLDSNGNRGFDAGVDAVFLYGLITDQFVGGNWNVTPPVQPSQMPVREEGLANWGVVATALEEMERRRRGA